MSGPGSLVGAIDYIQGARRAVHESVCPEPIRGFPCVACPSSLAAAAALDELRAVNGAASGCRPARLALHDHVCRSGADLCDSRDDHARRTQGRVATALRRYVQAEAAS